MRQITKTQDCVTLPAAVQRRLADFVANGGVLTPQVVALVLADAGQALAQGPGQRPQGAAAAESSLFDQPGPIVLPLVGGCLRI